MFGGTFVGLVGLLALPILLSPIQAQQQQQPCGRLRQWQLHNQKNITDPDEYPWLGRVGYKSTNKSDSNESDEITYGCLSVLLSERHAILPAHCVQQVDSTDTYTAAVILFGDWRSDENTNTIDCLTPDRCASPPESYRIMEVAVHPMYDHLHIDNNIALAKLSRNVHFGDFVQPICLPPDYEVAGNHIGQRLEMVGFLQEFPSWRVKRQVHTIGSKYCNSLSGESQFIHSSNQICGIISGNDSLAAGSPMMGVNVVDGNPDSFYLIAIVAFVVDTETRNPVGFMRIYPYRDWIIRNMV